LSIDTCKRIVAASFDTCGVVNSVLQCATCTGWLFVSQTLRYSPPPGYQRAESGGLSRRIASWFVSPGTTCGVRSSRHEL
jgi:hypothetical protein